MFRGVSGHSNPYPIKGRARLGLTHLGSTGTNSLGKAASMDRFSGIVKPENRIFYLTS
jgi:hypothetical protein